MIVVALPAGLMVDQLCFKAVAGQYSVPDNWIYADVAFPRVVFNGDSITSGQGLMLSQRWATTP